MYSGDLKTSQVRRLAKSVTFLCRNASEYSWKNSGFEVRSGVASACRLPKCPTLQRIPTNRDVNEREKPYSTFKIEHDRTRIQEMWQRSRIGAREQKSLRGYQPANSDVNTDSKETINALDKVKRIEERRKIQNKMRALMEEQHMKDERIQEEKDRVIRKEVLVERDPARKQTFAEYSPFRNREKGKPETWVSATVLAATGKMQQHRYMQTPPKKMNPLKVEVVVQKPSQSVREKSATGTTSGQPNHTHTDMSSRAKWAKAALELHKKRAKEMDDILSLGGYSNESACLKLSELSSMRKARRH
uniref:Hydra, isoform A n=2 Tax=Drosophila melanogaster TaxID=7227 RepID=Q8IQ35_DROME|nr:hydra, isoform J [Drosophila melanogaster]NP_001245782.1 hydra, isoform F [Drosophila melanogaster]NP_608405.4 hydra, isoform A [Drosophila melanogaster]AAN09535.2 hydra, isoform A [Drosophila melanogaster]ACZ95345.2 hydra, isoform J [Drosophila melanogaster]AFH07494.1 hydra, isoform F [Drosophila melanogaster]|eukprot:NP_001162812.2 hydra, isoform J [Drosophila melanogaster]